jgi:uncharacterized protein
MSAARPRVIFDCNVLLQAILNAGGPSRACVMLAVEHQILVMLSDDAISEAREVLGRHFVQVKRPDIAQDEIDELLGSLIYVAEILHDVPAVVSFPRDPKDEPYLDLCIAGKADYLLTRDRDLLDLTSDHSIEAKQFRQLTRNQLRIVDPVTFLRELHSNGVSR